MSDQGMLEGLSEAAKDLLATLRGAQELRSEDPTYAEADDYVEPPVYEKPVSVEEVKEVMEYLEVPEEHQDKVYEEWEAEGQYDTGSLVKVIADNDEIGNWIDQSQNVDGHIHGGVRQENESQVINADDGAVVAGGNQHDVQALTGDGSLQIGGGNWGEVIQGDSNVSAEGAHINDSAIAFGEGDATNTANDSVTAHSNNDYSEDTDVTIDVADSGNYTSDQTHTATEDIDLHLTNSANESSTYVEDNDWKDVDDSHNYDGDHDVDPAH